MHQEHIHIAGAPAYLFRKLSAEESKKNGCILFYHGLGVSKETHEKELRSLAEQGFCAIGIDNIGHGERRYSNFEELFSDENNWEKTFLQAVSLTAKEVPRIIDELLLRGWAQEKKIGVSGISMGGYISYAAISQDKRISTAAPILGSPQWKQTLEESPHNHINHFFPCAILSQNAGKDTNVPAHFARDFHKTLEPLYTSQPEKLKYLEYPESDHFMREEDWDQLWSEVLHWFRRFLIDV